jgi:hypothetical protein
VKVSLYLPQDRKGGYSSFIFGSANRQSWAVGISYFFHFSLFTIQLFRHFTTSFCYRYSAKKKHTKKNKYCNTLLATVKSGNIVFGINIVISEAQFVIANNLLIYD